GAGAAVSIGSEFGEGAAMSVTIHERESGTTLAEAEVGPSLARYEGNWYLDPAAVRAEVLRISERTYTCPYKGTCNWVDYVGPDGKTVADVAWVYPAPKPGHEAIKDRYGFYAGSRGPTRQDWPDGLAEPLRVLRL